MVTALSMGDTLVEPGRITVAGFAGCPYHEKAKAIAEDLAGKLLGVLLYIYLKDVFLTVSV